MSFFKKLGERALQKAMDVVSESLARGGDATTPAFQPGNAETKTAIVLSAPGSAEVRAGRPAAGQTGKTLNRILARAHKRDPHNFPSPNKDDYRIINASAEPEYKARTGRTEANKREISRKENIERIKDGLSGMERVVALGDRAREAVEKSEFKGKKFSAGHPSMQHLNRKIEGHGETPSARHQSRVEKFADKLVNSGKRAPKRK